MNNLMLKFTVIIVLINVTIISCQPVNIIEDETIIVLVVGFGPFLNHSINPSELIAAELDGEIINNAEIIGLQVHPNLSNFSESIEIVYQAIEDINPNYIFSIGLAAKYEKIRIEKIGYNLKIEIKDNSKPEKIIIDGPWFYISPLPANIIVKNLRSQKIPAQTGIFPGLSLCNGLLYSVLYYIDLYNLNIKSGFIHVPLIKTEENPNGMEFKTMLNATKIIIQVCLDFPSNY